MNYGLRNLDISLKLLEEAMGQIEDAEVPAHYGEVLWVSGYKNQAISVWNDARLKYPSSKVLLETIARFKKYKNTRES